MKKTALLGSLLLLAVACGRAAPEAAAPRAPGDEPAPTSLAGSAEQQEEPASLAEAEALLDRAKADLDRLALNDPGGVPATAAAAPAPAPAAPPAPSRAEAERPAEKSAAQDSASPKKEETTCETACKAFSSLERASSAVCRLDTEAPAKRCERAKQIKDDAARRVSSCSCR
jgi:hypothetical protein